MNSTPPEGQSYLYDSASIHSIAETTISPHMSVLIRADFDVPLDTQGHIIDDRRIRAVMPTLQYIFQRNAKVILVAHLGRPHGERHDALHFTTVQQRLQELLQRPVQLETKIPLKRESAQEIVLLDNIRFHPEEERNDPIFAHTLAQCADIFVFDAFATAHRAHASTTGITRFLPSVIGLSVRQEITVLSHVMAAPQHPFFIIIGGAKIPDKVKTIEHLLTHADGILTGGAVANTFLQGLGQNMSLSLVDHESLPRITKLTELAKKKNIPIFTPSDGIIKDVYTDEVQYMNTIAIPPSYTLMDIGKQTITQYKTLLQKAKTIVWAGSLGVTTDTRFQNGTLSIAQLCAACSDRGATTIIGGGDTAGFITQMSLDTHFTHMSTGGSAFLEFLAGHSLPALDAIIASQKHTTSQGDRNGRPSVYDYC